MVEPKAPKASGRRPLPPAALEHLQRANGSLAVVVGGLDTAAHSARHARAFQAPHLSDLAVLSRFLSRGLEDVLLSATGAETPPAEPLSAREAALVDDLRTMATARARLANARDALRREVAAAQDFLPPKDALDALVGPEAPAAAGSVVDAVVGVSDAIQRVRSLLEEVADV